MLYNLHKSINIANYLILNVLNCNINTTAGAPVSRKTKKFISSLLNNIFLELIKRKCIRKDNIMILLIFYIILLSILNNLINTKTYIINKYLVKIVLKKFSWKFRIKAN